MSINFVEGASVKPGQILGKASDIYEIGDGVAVRGTKMIAVLKGKAFLKENEKTSKKEVYVTRGGEKSLGIAIDDDVITRVQKIKKDTVFVDIIVVNGTPISIPLAGVIKRKDVREKEVDKIRMQDCFIPGDIVKAKVASYGDSRRIQLNTHLPDYGVMFARSEVTNQLMFPINPEEMICPVSQVKEKRKVAVPDLDNFGEEGEEGMDIE